MLRSGVVAHAPGPTLDPREAGDAFWSRTVEVGDLWRILWCRRTWIVASVLLCALGGLVYVVATPLRYTASAQILIDPRNRQILGKDVTPDTLAADGGVIQVESQLRVIESDTVLLRAIKTLGLEQDPEFGRARNGFLAVLADRIFGKTEVSGPDTDRNKALRMLRKRLAVKRADKQFVIDIVYTASSPEKAARIADAIAEAYLADQVQARAQSSDRASTALASRLNDLGAQVKAAEDRVEQYKAEHDLVGTARELVSDQQLVEINTQLSTAHAKTTDLRVRADELDRLRNSKADVGTVPETIQSAALAQLLTSYTGLLRRESDLRTRYGGRFPELIALLAEVRETRRAIGSEINRLARGAHSDLERAQKSEQALEHTFAGLKQKAVASGDASSRLRQLEAAVTTRRSIYQEFLGRTAETKEQSGIDNTNARIISNAIPPDRHSWPPDGFILLGAIGAGLGLGVALAFFAEYMRPTILSKMQLERSVDVPVVGVLPTPSRRRLFRRNGASQGTSNHDRRVKSALGLALSRLCGPLGELRTEPRPHSLLVTSAPGDEGARAEILERLVETAAEYNISVLLVEADLRSPTCDVDGLLDVLRGDCRLAKTTMPQGSGGARRLSVGRLDHGAVQTMRSETIKNFLHYTGQHYDLIVFDGGAFTENIRIAPLVNCVDDVVLVVVGGVTSQRAATDTSAAVSDAAGRPISAALLFQ